ncbi:zinc-dependent alcohol dehydrogenase [Pseudomonas sp. RIT-PI-S]|uniref:zinc-dependent alcohol dehydrogenase n=1 Tax=Pseudomonas sp. RIT-PI-S TaxID=3035295 RepID=UPI0021DA1594|nr:zinc-dependent alcohol dehydrogenase [Pseudomonas sp. RIT-PI-S]
MRALTWQGPNHVQVDTVPDPTLLNPQDAIIQVTLSSVCGSDLHLLGGYVPTMHAGDILGHEFLGEVVEVGARVSSVRKGDRVITVSIIGCGECEHCRRQDFSCCDNSNPNPCVTEMAYGQPCGGIIGYSHAFGGYAGSHATYIRVPYADVNLFKVPEGVSDEQAVFVSDAAPTGYFAADNAGIEPGDTVAVWGCGAVGQMAIASAYLLGAERVIAIDRLADRLMLAENKLGAVTLDYETTNIHQALLELTGGRGPDRCIDCVGMEAHGTEADFFYDKTKQLLRLHTERGTVLRQAIRACRKGGTVSVVGVYGGLLDKFPMGAVVNKGLTLRGGQQPGQRYANRLFELIQQGQLDPSWLLTHPMDLEDAPQGYKLFKEKSDQCLRAVFRP